MLTALTQVVRTVEGRAASPSGSDRPSWASYVPARKAWVFAARLAVTMAVAETVRLLVPLEKPYWIVLTAALVLKPDFGSIFARGVQRTLGTLVGVVLGVAVVAVVPHGAWLLLPMAVLAFAFPYGRSLNYGLLSTFLTPLVLLLIDFGTRVDGRVALDRLLDTVIGAGVVLVVGYLCWPGTWHPRLGEHIAAGVEALAAYARVAFGADRSLVGPARRRAYAAMSDIRSELQSTLAEPPPVSRQAAAWWPMIAQLEKTTDDLSEAAARARHPAARPPADDAGQLVAGFEDLAGALRGAPGAPGPAAARLRPARRPGGRPARPAGHRPGTDRCLRRTRAVAGRTRARAGRLASAGGGPLRGRARRDRPGHRARALARGPGRAVPGAPAERAAGREPAARDRACRAGRTTPGSASRSRSGRCPRAPGPWSCRAARRAARCCGPSASSSCPSRSGGEPDALVAGAVRGRAVPPAAGRHRGRGRPRGGQLRRRALPAGHRQGRRPRRPGRPAGRRPQLPLPPVLPLRRRVALPARAAREHASAPGSRPGSGWADRAQLFCASKTMSPAAVPPMVSLGASGEMM